jgi:hypothetical protein
MTSAPFDVVEMAAIRVSLANFFSHLLANVWRSMSTRVDGIRHKMLPSFSLADYFDDIRTF